MSFSVLVLHGPNLSLLADGEIDPRLEARAQELGVELVFIQANGEQGLLDALHEEAAGVDGVLVNPGALAPLAFALAEGLQQTRLPVVEVLLQLMPAERGASALTGVAQQQVHGLGVEGYVRGLELLVPEGKQRVPAVEQPPEEEEPAPVVRGKSIGRKTTTLAAPAAVAKGRGKTLGRSSKEKKAPAPAPSTRVLTRVQVRDRIKLRLKGTETAEALAQWARETWTGLQRGAPAEAGAKETIENVLLTLMSGAKANASILIDQMAKLDS